MPVDALAIGALQERRPRREERRPRRTLFPGASPGSGIRNSSSLCPELSAATSHRGRLPRPDHVSVGADGLEYFGKTFGYLRLGRPPLRSGGLAASPTCSARLSCLRRFSNLRFSAPIFAARIFVSSSCKSQSSSK